MSTTARGIILTGDLGKLLIEASDAEVERFGKGDLVSISRLKKAQTPRKSLWLYGGGELDAGWSYQHAAWPEHAGDVDWRHGTGYLYDSHGSRIAAVESTQSSIDVTGIVRYVVTARRLD